MDYILKVSTWHMLRLNVDISQRFCFGFPFVQIPYVRAPPVCKIDVPCRRYKWVSIFKCITLGTKDEHAAFSRPFTDIRSRPAKCSLEF